MRNSVKMQEVDFQNVNEFLEFLPENELIIVETLRQIIYQCIPEATEKLNYNVPFFKRNKNFCFIWPASILWGKKKTYTGVRLGFTTGYLLKDRFQYLEKGNRKQVYMKDFQNVNEIDDEIIRELLFETVEVDDHFKKTNKKI